MKDRTAIKVILVRKNDDGYSRTESSIKTPHVTPLMLEVADELLYVMATGKRLPRKR